MCFPQLTIIRIKVYLLLAELENTVQLGIDCIGNDHAIVNFKSHSFSDVCVCVCVLLNANLEGFLISGF